MDSLTLQSAVLGGALIGLGAGGLLLTHGRIAGLSGLMVRAVDPRADDRGSAVAFLGGLVAAGVALSWLAPALAADRTTTPIDAVVVAGLLVGYGARLANGCTSGHGLCGVGRLAPRSMVATALFVGVGAVSLLITRALLAGAS